MASSVSGSRGSEGINWQDCGESCGDAATYVLAPLVGLVVGVACSPLWLIAFLYAKGCELYHRCFSAEFLNVGDNLDRLSLSQLNHELRRREVSASLKILSNCFVVFLALAVPYLGVKLLQEDKLDLDESNYACGLNKTQHDQLLRELRQKIVSLPS